MSNKPKKIIIHHPAVTQATINNAKGVKLRDNIRNYHINSLEWADIGYHYIININEKGQYKVYDGRSDKVMGAHCFGHNRDTLGVSLAYAMGTEPSQDALETLAKLIYTLCKTYNIKINRENIKGHREMSGHKTNACPGDGLFRKLNYVVDLAKKMENGQLPSSSIPEQKPKEQVQEKHISEIDVLLPNGVVMEAMLMDGTTKINLTAINKILLSMGLPTVNIEYDSENHMVRVSK